MVFSELLVLMLQKTDGNINELADQLGITTQSVRNILNRKIIKPDGDTSEKINIFCRKNNIDTSDLDWNQIIYDYFSNTWQYSSNYYWIGGLDRRNTVLLEHKDCGKRSRVPISALDGNGLLCIHCWTDRYIPTNVYSFKLTDWATDYDFTHIPCGHEYTVTYEQIKQKKYRCPKCYSNSLNANTDAITGRTQNYNFINKDSSLPTWYDVDIMRLLGSLLIKSNLC